MTRRLIARLLIGVFAGRFNRDDVLGDLDEARARIAANRSRSAADWWFLRQAVIIAAYSLRDRMPAAWAGVRSLRWETHEFRYALRALARTPAFSAVAVSS